MGLGTSPELSVIQSWNFLDLITRPGKENYTFLKPQSLGQASIDSPPSHSTMARSRGGYELKLLAPSVDHPEVSSLRLSP